ncbi:MAG TPA: type I phosphomannose isomerase catalytic subunit [Fimbriimonas sp.]|nr:type I phosphomannose isomerase catalytic subunit [Fimbriimonas sp.]
MDSPTPLYPLRFEPIYQYRLWGGRKLASLGREPLPGDGPIGEAWILSDRDDFASKVANGPLEGKTIKDLLGASKVAMLGRLAPKYDRFPLLLKYLDAKEMLSVQVHPSDKHKDLLPPGENGKTEAWVVLQAEPNSFIYAGLKPGTSEDNLRHLTAKNADDYLAGFHPQAGEGVFIQAGTVHALGGGVMVFEVQQNSDVTFRLFDWDRVDAKTGKPRELHIEKAIECTDMDQGEIGPVTPEPVSADRVKFFQSEHFTLWRIASEHPFTVGHSGVPRVAVCIEGKGTLGSDAVRKGDVWLLPASVGETQFVPTGEATVLEVALPE